MASRDQGFRTGQLEKFENRIAKNIDESKRLDHMQNDDVFTKIENIWEKQKIDPGKISTFANALEELGNLKAIALINAYNDPKQRKIMDDICSKHSCDSVNVVACQRYVERKAREEQGESRIETTD